MKKPPVIHPFLFAIFPILALYAYTSRVIPISFGEIGIPISFSLAGSAIIYFFLNAMIKHAHKAGLLASLVLLWFFSYGHATSRLKPWRLGVSDDLFFIGSLIFLVVVFIFVIRSKKDYFHLTIIMNIMGVFLLVFNLIAASRVLLHTTRISTIHQTENVSRSAHSTNIYFMLLDGYARADVLLETYGFDNSDFIKYLEQTGFYVASQSPANFCQTDLSLASSLNLTYLDELAARMGRQSANRQPLVQMIKDSQVRSLLKNHGYSFVSFASGFSETEIRNADFYVSFKGSLTEFRNHLLNTTPLPLFLSNFLNISQYDLHRRRILSAFQSLSSFSYEKSPFFVFSHIVSPHPPFVFGENGETIRPVGPFSIDDGDDLHGAEKAGIQNYITGYRAQLFFINKKIKETVDSILANSKVPPIIILQSDHGPRAFFDWESAEVSYLKESMSVLNAVYLPGGDYHDFYPGISPVNTFIALINHITGSKKQFLKDKSFYSTWKRPYDFVPFNPQSYSKTLSGIDSKKVQGY